jgi:hypothetical protein
MWASNELYLSIISIMAQAKTQMQTQEADSTSLRVYYRGRQRVVIQIRVRQVQDVRQVQGQDRLEGQNWED